MRQIWLFGFILCTLVSGAVVAQTTPLTRLQEQRYCGPPNRNPDGTISRSSTVRNAFRHVHACPATGYITGPCPGWSIDHVIPLVCGGCDAVSNLQWLPNDIKSCKGTICKDRWEQRAYCSMYRRPE